MSSIPVDDTIFSAVAGKNVIITGGSTGIGEATVRLLHGTHGNIRTPLLRRNTHTDVTPHTQKTARP